MLTRALQPQSSKDSSEEIIYHAWEYSVNSTILVNQDWPLWSWYDSTRHALFWMYDDPGLLRIASTIPALSLLNLMGFPNSPSLRLSRSFLSVLGPELLETLLSSNLATSFIYCFFLQELSSAIWSIYSGDGGTLRIGFTEEYASAKVEEGDIMSLQLI